MALREALREVWAGLKRLDPANFVKERYGLSGWKAEAVDWFFAFLFAALLYYVVAPFLLGANPPAVIVQSCSMAGVLNVGDVVILQGVSFRDVNVPEVHLNTSGVYFEIYPEDRTLQTEKLIFPNGGPSTVTLTRDGPIIVYVSTTSGKQIVHRVVAKVVTSDGKRYYITKGDANTIPDAAKIECEEWIRDGDRLVCLRLASKIKDVCRVPRDKNWPGCISGPVPEDKVVGRVIFDVPLIGHVKLLLWHILTLGHGYPDRMIC